MKQIKITLWVILVGLSALWLFANLPFPEELNFIALRNLLVQYSGVLSIGAMSVAMILATRMHWVEPWLNGLDKSYRLHKWLGIAALTTSVVHWVAAKGPKWMVSWGIMGTPERGQRPEGIPDLGAIQTFFNSQRGTAETLGEWAFYGAGILIILALIKRFPYKIFVSTHMLIAIAYLVLVFHAAVLMDFDFWTQPVGGVVALLMIGGVVSGVLSLTRQIGRNRLVPGTISRIRTFTEMRVTEIEIHMDEGWKGHEAGQFSFVTFDRREGKHPFTMASAWDPATRNIMFISKGLGDYTNFLPEKLTVGGEAKVEGPYGRFTFHCTKERQIWIAGGIGITPFIARMKQMAMTPGTKTIDLIHSINEIAPEALELLKADAAAAGVTLHLVVDSKDGPLTGARLREMVPNWQSSSVWFCGPAGFGQALRKDLVAEGLASGAFHQELFNMR
ncbi:ferric reductase-like transmembrane domain-containing protein [Yoonia sp. I 8.24]|nr:ferric reductase-like transmembrane domain-containing protein [Yoonia sp. I 8.24]